jgi:DNA-directed RNA polymerase specialized sigma24 family protein
MKHTIDGKSASEITALVDEHIVGRKAKRNREILKDRFIEGLTFEELAEKHDLSVTMVKKIVYQCVDVLADFIR